MSILDNLKPLDYFFVLLLASVCIIMYCAFTGSVDRDCPEANTEHMTSESNEALQTVAAVYNRDTMSVNNMNVTSKITSGDVQSNNLQTNVLRAGNIGCCDVVFGKEDTNRGNCGNCRAIVKDSGATLVLNYGNDFTGGTRTDGLFYAKNLMSEYIFIDTSNTGNIGCWNDHCKHFDGCCGVADIRPRIKSVLATGPSSGYFTVLYGSGNGYGDFASAKYYYTKDGNNTIYPVLIEKLNPGFGDNQGVRGYAF
ncbi:hypothetical protein YASMINEVIRUS_1412 [Yasminevirus sp. GU-2018]|uniref:Uncharacterized protein n=1 Tax=Yasminevirus sp. GU-2018 TaxID=2420051 RepID=A0A5K0UB13_9VIRU|nr:hypothetical protein YASMINEVIRUS_1412 [Yasminevirus sp. GU-2018]